MKYYNTSLGNCAAPSSGVYQVSNTLIRKPPLVRAPCTAIGIAPLLSARPTLLRRSRPYARDFCAAAPGLRLFLLRDFAARNCTFLENLHRETAFTGVQQPLH